MIVGDVARTTPPEPVTALPSAAATPVPRPDTPVEIGNPVAFVSVAAEGVPRLGVVRVGDVARTIAPDPVTPGFAQVNPVLVVHCNEAPVALHPGIANAVGDALALVPFARTVLAAIAAIPFRPTPPHAGALDAPVDTIACPLDEPVGLSN